jgi:hypothetical protein
MQSSVQINRNAKIVTLLRIARSLIAVALISVQCYWCSSYCMAAVRYKWKHVRFCRAEIHTKQCGARCMSPLRHASAIGMIHDGYVQKKCAATIGWLTQSASEVTIATKPSHRLRRKKDMQNGQTDTSSGQVRKGKDTAVLTEGRLLLVWLRPHSVFL